MLLKATLTQTSGVPACKKGVQFREADWERNTYIYISMCIIYLYMYCRCISYPGHIHIKYAEPEATVNVLEEQLASESSLTP